MGEERYAETIFSVDVEASGPIPGLYSLLSIGAVPVGDYDRTFYVELKPLVDPETKLPASVDVEAMKVNGLDLAVLKEKGEEPAEAMRQFRSWVRTVCEIHGAKLGMRATRPIFGSFGTFDWLWVSWYFHNFDRANPKANPFGPNGLDFKSYWMGAANVPTWRGTTKKWMPPHLLQGLPPHSHNALEDAVEQAILFQRVRDWRVSLEERERSTGRREVMVP